MIKEVGEGDFGLLHLSALSRPDTLPTICLNDLN
jgi:hypothetical protein